MKRYAAFTALFALAPMVSGPFVVSPFGAASPLEWAHIFTGFVTLYLLLGLLLKSMKNRKIRRLAIAALALGLVEAIPGIPQLHAAISPILFATLACAVMALSEEEPAHERSRWIFLLPAVVLLPVFYGVRYRHQTSGFLPHIAAAMAAGGLLVGFCMVMNERYPANTRLHRACNLTIAAVLFQIVLGIAAFIVRLLEIDGGLLLAVVRVLHITGAAPVLAASTELAIQYRRNGPAESSPALLMSASNVT